MKKAKNDLTVLFIFLVTLFIPMRISAQSESDMYVYDWANVLEEEVENKIQEDNAKLQEVQDAQIYVVTINSLGGKNIEDKTTEIFEDLGLDEYEINHSIMLLLAIEDSIYYCFNGNDILEEIKDNFIYIYLDEDFKAGNYSEGVNKTFDGMYRHAYNMKERAEEPVTQSSGYSDEQNAKINEGRIYIVIILIVLAVLGYFITMLTSIGSGILRKGEKRTNVFSDSYHHYEPIRQKFNPLAQREKLDIKYTEYPGTPTNNLPPDDKR